MVCTALEITYVCFVGKYLTVFPLFRKKPKYSAHKKKRQTNPQMSLSPVELALMGCRLAGAR